MSKINSNSIVADSVKLGEYVIIKDDVEIGEGCIIGNSVVIYDRVRIGMNVRIDDNTVIGKKPMRAANSALLDQRELDYVEIGDGCIVGTSAVIYAGCKLGENVLVADLATLREDVIIGKNTIIGRGVAVENHCSIGSYSKLETNAYITAYSTLEDYVFIAPGVVTSNDNYAGRTRERLKHFKGVVIKTGGRIGAQATILPGKVIYEDGFVAAGSVVTKDVEKETIVLGNPGKKKRTVPDEQLLVNQDFYNDKNKK